MRFRKVPHDPRIVQRLAPTPLHLYRQFHQRPPLPFPTPSMVNMIQLSTNPKTLDDWARQEAIPFDIASDESFHAAVDRMVAAMGDTVELVGLGEPTHGIADFLTLRNRLFQRLAEAHGFKSIALESSFPRARLVNDYITGTSGPTSYDDIAEAGFSHGFGAYPTTRELVEWMHEYNAGRPNDDQLRFYGFDAPLEMMWSDSPRRLIEFVLDYLDDASGSNDQRRLRIKDLLGDDAAWETEEAAFDPSKSIGLSPAAAVLRVEVEELASELSVRRPSLIAARGESAHREALHYTIVARQLLNYHAAIARPAESRPSSDRLAHLLGIRDATMADNLIYIAERERNRGRTLVFAHNKHLQRGAASWQWGPNLIEWWPAGAHVGAILGSRYAVVGVGVGTSKTLELITIDAGTLEAHLTAAPGPARFIPTHQAQGFDNAAITAIPTRSEQNPRYFPLNAKSLTDFDWLAVLDSVT